MVINKPTLYFNTGFNVCNIPDSPALIYQCDSITFDDHIALQDYFISSFKLKATWDQVKNADYMHFGNAWYFVKPRMINENCAEIFCQLDALTTMGGPLAQNFVGGVLVRAHALSDGVGENTCEDAVGPSSILRAVNYTATPTIGSGAIRVIASTVKLNDISADLLDPTNKKDALVFSGQITAGTEQEEYIVAIPKGPAPAEPTTIHCLGGTTKTVGYGLYDADNATVKRNLEYIRSLGLSDCILFSYEIPEGMATYSPGTNGHIASLNGANNFIEKVSLSYSSDFGSGIHNRKTYLTANKFAIRSALSGDLKEFEAKEIVTSGGAITFEVATDPQMGGTSYCAPGVYFGSDNLALKVGNSAKGLPWKEIPIAFNGASGSLLAKNNLKMSLGDLQRNSLMRTIPTLKGATDFAYAKEGIISNIAGLSSTIMSGITGSKTYNSNLDPFEYEKTKEIAQFKQSQIVSPDLSTSPALGLQNFLANNFNIIHLVPTTSDQQKIDKFYTMFGYAQPNIAFDKAYLSGRQYFNYIETSGVHIARSSASNYGIAIKNAAEDQLNAGVRIWHVLPTTVTTNPIV